MDQTCKNHQCKKKSSELYSDIDSLETDIKDKDTFVQAVVKARNALQEDVAKLTKKNRDLIRENNDLTEKVDQLDEDTDTGLEFLKNAHERERKLNVAVEEYKKKSANDEEKVSKLSKENEDLKQKFTFIKNQFEKSLKENQESCITREAKIKDLEKEINNLKEITEQHDNEMKSAENKFHQIGIQIMEQTVQIDALEMENKSLKQKNNDLDDELSTKIKELDDIDEKSTLTSSQSSLKEELSQLQIFQCENVIKLL
jgi:chromosome segregation ATPase